MSVCYREIHYNASIGRFIQEDPARGRMQAPRTFNSEYAYVLNNPVNNIDPSGEVVFTASFIATAAFASASTFGGGVAGAAILGGALAGLGTLALDEATNQGGGFFSGENSLSTLNKVGNSDDFRRELFFSVAGGALGGAGSQALTSFAKAQGASQSLQSFVRGFSKTLFTSVGATAGGSLATERGRENFGSNVGKAALIGTALGAGAGSAAVLGSSTFNLITIVKEHSVLIIMEMPIDQREPQ